ncbi:hypothetical protein [Roseibium sp. RKSG952]|uniref:hypothetical protein n=1 Tax=Roseibium sp. RKSG952 TaxID=2529384 RepID=UPI0012BB51B3|nr:hypothetical protein [Roseibium sp. RKSG952]MTH95835.1 hypothetical protein [Roseibium sp. RKSG952]
MRFEFDYKYAISYKPFRAVNPRSSPALSHTSIEVREVDLVDAPLVARIGTSEDQGVISDKPSYALKSNGDRRELRYINGRFFIEVQSAEETKEALATGTRNTPFQKIGTELIGTDPHACRYAGFGRKPEKIYKTVSDIARENPRCRELSDNNAETKEMFRKFAEHFVVVEGVLFQETPEPIVEFTNYGSCKVQPTYCPNYYQNYESDLQYSWDHFSSTKWADNLVDAVGRLEKEGEMPPYEILDPRPFLFDGVSHGVYGQAEALFQAMQSAVWRMGDDFIEAYYDLKEAIDKSPNRCVTLEIENALQRVTACDTAASKKINDEIREFNAFAREDDRHNGDTFFRDEYFGWSSDQFDNFGHMAMRALEHWNTREVERYWPDVGSLPGKPLAGSGGEGAVSELNSVGKIAMAFYGTGIDVIDLQKRIDGGFRYFEVKTRRNRGVAEVSPDGDMRAFGEFSEEHMKALPISSLNNLKAAMS